VSTLNPLRPVRDVIRMVTMPLKAVFVVALCGLINWMTYAGTWWVKWVALGMGIAVVLSLARGLKALLLLALAVWIGRWLLRRHGPAARAAFDDWVRTTRPEAADMLRSLRVVRGGAA
jgi:UPF0716 family protein affecting phage T7 exclusion